MKNTAHSIECRVEGNSLFLEGRYREALIAYNRSICFALPRSPELALAYGNRSAVYLEVGFFNECLENIVLARKYNHPGVARLDEREARCLIAARTNSRAEDIEKFASGLFKLSYPPHITYPWIAECLELCSNDRYGRYIITNRNLKQGDVISVEEPAFEEIFDPTTRYERCTLCFKTSRFNLIPCDDCAMSE